MNWLKRLFIVESIKRLFKKCDHDWEFVRNLYGDEINFRNGNRSLWECRKCGKIEYRRYLQTTTIIDKLDKLYDKYYQDKYEDWKILRADILNGMLQTMMSNAREGQCYADFILICEEKYNDKNYYEKWFTDNKLKCETNLYNQNEKCDELNKYKFEVRWKYKW